MFGKTTSWQDFLKWFSKNWNMTWFSIIVMTSGSDLEKSYELCLLMVRSHKPSYTNSCVRMSMVFREEVEQCVGDVWIFLRSFHTYTADNEHGSLPLSSLWTSLLWFVGLCSRNIDDNHLCLMPLNNNVRYEVLSNMTGAFVPATNNPSNFNQSPCAK